MTAPTGGFATPLANRAFPQDIFSRYYLPEASSVNEYRRLQTLLQSMTNELLNRLISFPPRDRAGPIASGRFDYQAHYCILKILELLKTDAHFEIVLDHEDDVFVLDSLTAPTSITLFQVKTKTPGNFTVEAMCKAVGAERPRSIIARMYGNIDKFQNLQAKSVLVSNARFRLKSKTGKDLIYTSFRFADKEAHDDVVKALTKAVGTDFEGPLIIGWLSNVELHNCGMGTAAQSETVKGFIVGHFDAANIDIGGRITPVYNELFSTIKHKIRREGVGTDVLGLIREKAISRPDVEKMFEHVAARRPSLITDWFFLGTEMAAAGMKTLEQIKIRKGIEAYFVARQEGRSDAAALSAEIRQALDMKQAEITSCSTLLEVLHLFEGTAWRTIHSFTSYEITGALLQETYEALNENRKPAGPSATIKEFEGQG